jgi:hypothetical protein
LTPQFNPTSSTSAPPATRRVGADGTVDDALSLLIGDAGPEPLGDHLARLVDMIVAMVSVVALVIPILTSCVHWSRG